MPLLSISCAAPFLALVVTGALPAVAQGVVPVSLAQVAPASLRLRIANPACFTGQVQVVRLRTGQTLFMESYATPAYGHRFDFDRAPSGRYLIWLRLGPAHYRYTVQVKTRAEQSVAQVRKLAIQYYPAPLTIAAH